MKIPISLFALIIFSFFTTSAQTQCFTGTDDPPGCLYRCKLFDGDLFGFSPDSQFNISSNCSFNSNTQWFSVVAANDSFEIFLRSLSMPNGSFIEVQVFDAQLNPVSNCEEIGRPPKNGTHLVTGLTVGDIYSVSVTKNVLQSTYFSLTLKGNEIDTLGQIGDITTTQMGDTVNYSIDSVPGALNYSWSTFYPDTTITASGLTTYQVDWSGRQYGTVCVNVDNNCEISAQKCRTVFIDTGISPCLPVSGGVPAGNDPPGCQLCGPIYQGSTAGYTPSAPGSAGFPCGTIENNQFISIVADDTGMLSATVLASQCQNSQGIQIMIFDQSFNPVSNCFSSPFSLPGNVVANNLTPGEIYWIMIDGFAGDICDILVTISGGINTGPPNPPGPITANPDTSPLCPGSIVCYSIDPIAGAIDYEWVIPGNSQIVSGGGSNDIEVCVEFTEPGGGVIRATASNPCFPGIPVLHPVVVTPILPTLKPVEFICPNEFPIVRDGNTFADFGTHEIVYTTLLGCDSMVNYVFVPEVQVPNLIDTFLCPGQCIFIDGICYDEPGTQTINLEAPNNQSNGCDSIIILTINNAGPVAEIIPVPPIGCGIGNTFVLDGTGSSVGNEFSYEWVASNGGLISGSADQLVSEGTGAGTYFLFVNEHDSAGNILCFSLDTLIVSPGGTVPTSDFTISQNTVCQNELIEVVYTGTGNPNADYIWDFSGADIISGSGQGPYLISYHIPDIYFITLTVVEGSCISSLTSNLLGVLEIPEDIIISCSSTINEVIFSWNPVAGAAAYQVSISGAASVTVTTTEFVVSGLSPGETVEITVSAVQNSSCGNSSSTLICITQDCPVVLLEINPIGPFCQGYDQPINLIYNTTGGSGAGTAQWTSTGNSVTPDGILNIANLSPGSYTIQLIYSEGACTYSEILVYEIEEKPGDLIISCSSTVDEITFAWNPVSGVTDYEVSISGASPIIIAETEFVVSGLTPGEVVEITVTALVNTNCGNVTGSLVCETRDCPPVILNIDPVGSFCEGDNLLVNLNFNVSGGLGTGTAQWISPDNSVSPIGILTIGGQAPGSYTIQLIYTESGCSYSELLVYEIFENPELSASVLSPIWYPGTTGGIDITTTGGIPDYDYSWSDGSSSEDLTDVLTNQQYCVTVTDQNGCHDVDCYQIGSGIFRISPFHLLCRGESKRISVRPGRGADFNWTPGTGLSCTDCPNPILNPSVSTIYTVTATLPDGRMESTNVAVISLPPFFCSQAYAKNELENTISEKFDFDKIDDSDLDQIESEMEDIIKISKNEITVYPNPSTGIINILSISKIQNVEVFDFSGRKVLESVESNLDLSGNSKGVYILKIETTSGTQMKRVILL